MSKKIKRSGEKIAKKIDEYLATGKLRKLEIDEKNTAINLLTRVSGIGPAKAQSLVHDGIMTLEDLRKHTDKLTHHQMIGLKKEIEQIEHVLMKELFKLDPEYKVTICGSFRRGKQESGDIDTLITHAGLDSAKIDKKHKSNLLKNIVKALEKYGLVKETLSLGETKFMGACRLDENHPMRRLDIRFIPHDQYYCAVLYFTGSNIFNQNMRAHALEHGFTLNEYYLRPVGSTGIPGEPVEIKSEEDIFDFIDYPYKKPEERDS
nr:unnamed protein product [Callosobruchus analis]